MIVKELVDLAKNRVKKKSNKGLSGVSSGYRELDKLTDGWQNSDLITIGGRPSMGKTSFAISMLINISINSGTPCLFFSIESAAFNVMNKLISLESGLSLNKLRSGRLEKHEWEQLNVKTKRLKEAKLFIDDTPEILIDSLIYKVTELVLNQRVKIVVIDYLQLIRIDSKKYLATNREQEVSIIVKKLKALSKKINIPIVLFSQLNRNIDQRPNHKRPILSDLRDSGSIEEDSDLVCFLYRPEYYKIDEWDDDEYSQTDGQAEFIVAKNRNGGLENIRLKFIQHLGKFDNLEDFEQTLFKSTMNSAVNDDGFKASPDQAFGSSFNNDDNDVPF